MVARGWGVVVFPQGGSQGNTTRAVAHRIQSSKIRRKTPTIHDTSP